MFLNIEYLQWLWIVPIGAFAFVMAASRRRKARAQLAGPNAATALKRETPEGANLLRCILLLCALALLVIALAGPAWNPVEEKVERQGRDVVFVLDVSRSMLAEDLRPSRLERAKADVADCITALQGDRVALVAFAGNAVVQCPLTHDYGFFRMMLADLTPESVTRGGTNLGDALRLAQKQVFDGEEKEFKDVILITDGEDHDSLPVAAAQELGAAGIRLIAIGIGDDTMGAPIQVTDERGYKSNLKYHGEVVRSKLDSKTLREMAQATPGGVYLPVGTNAFDLRETYSRLVASAAQRQLDAEVVVHLQPKYQIFLGAAMLLLALAALLPRRRCIALLPLALLLLSANALNAQNARELFREGNKALKSDPAQAIQFYDQAAQALGETQWKELEFNRALAHYRSGSPENLAQAKELLLNAVELNRSSKNENENFDNNCQLLLGNVNYSLAKVAYETALPAKDSDNPQEIQQALQLVESHKDAINDAIHSLKQAKTNRRNRTAVQHALKQSRILRKELHELEKELREKLKEQQQNQQNQQEQRDQRDQQNQQQQKGQQNQQDQRDQQDKQDQQQSQESQESQQQQQDQQGQQDKQDQQQSQESQESQESQQQQQDQQFQNQEPKAAQAVKSEEQETPPDNQLQPLEQELQQVINAEKLHRMQQRARQSRQNPVDKDW